MEKKNNLIKNIFYIFFAFCFMFAGTIALNLKPEQKVYGENVISEEISNTNIPSYFSVEEFISTDGEVDNSSKTNLLGSDTFMYFSESNSSNQLELSLLTNGNEVHPADISVGQYNFAYYPDTSNTSIFHFYDIYSIDLYINGQQQENLSEGNYIIPSGLYFTNKDEVQLEGFNMTFSDKETANNNISIKDTNGNIVEGVYTISIRLTLYTCNNGKDDASEEFTSFTDQDVEINYSFYVIDRSNYLFNNRPTVNYFNFDSETTLSNPDYAYYLFSNYTSDGSAKEDANQIPYIEYDYTRFETTIQKDLAGETRVETLNFNKDSLTNDEEQVISRNGQSILKSDAIVVDKTTNTCKVYFTDVGDYTISFNAIQIVENRKYNLPAVTNASKKYKVHMFGYQATYTDLDAPTDENNIRPVAELKDYDFSNGTYIDGADITSGFINSNDSYSQANRSTTFLISNILDYINSANDGSVLNPIQTNQTPIGFTANATLGKTNDSKSYIYSTTKISSAYQDSGLTLGTETLYKTTFTGSTESTTGKYIYLIAYTYKNYYSGTTLQADTIFYQVFYFEIVKELPNIRVYINSEKQGETDVACDSFVNQDVYIEDTTKQPYNKDVVVRIFAKDFNTKSYIADFGDERGISFDEYYLNNGSDNQITLKTDAQYTVRLFFKNEIDESDLNINSKGYFREVIFTKDTQAIDGITARNVTEIVNSTNYAVGSALEYFSTNQNIVLSWNEKNSKAKTYAYYRYFPIVSENFYSAREGSLSTTLDQMLRGYSSAAYLPINSILNMSTDNNIWLPYTGNTFEFNTEVASEYVLSETGLYLVDVYDEAGNHTVEAFMIDTTKPIFAINDGSQFSIPSSSVYITNQSTIYWGDYKSLYITNFNTPAYNQSLNANNVSEDNLKNPQGSNEKPYYDFYTTYTGDVSTDIFKVIYNKLYSQKYMQYITHCTVNITSADNVGVSSYRGLYLTVPVEDLSYYADKNSNGFKPQYVNYATVNANEEMTYQVLIRDKSNTKFEQSPYTKQDSVQYTKYYSAKQTIIISYDSSQMFIQYQNDDGEAEILSSNRSVEGKIDVNGTERNTKTTYLSPISIKEPLTLSFLPTTDDTNTGLSIQVQEVTINYYPYVIDYIKDGEITYAYYRLSDTATPITVYHKDSGPMTSQKTEEIRLNSEGITTAGKYEITRTYCVDAPYSYNANDFYKRTYVLYVDRNEVITNAELVGEDAHLESLVGGDIFVGMYDDGTRMDLVVTFPDSPDGNPNGSSLYNNGQNVKSILTTNKLPVYVYVPMMKYTQYAKKVSDGANKYHYEVYSDKLTDSEYNIVEGKDTTLNYYDNQDIISEYVIYAEIYKDGTSSANKIAWSTGSKETTTHTHGFLDFYNVNTGSKIEYLSEEGTYYVMIYQGRFVDGVLTSSFETCSKFCFDIKSANPDFEAQLTTGSTLESINNNEFETYYTNQTTVNLVWQAGSEYMAEIDKNAIKFVTKNGSSNFGEEVFKMLPTKMNDMWIATIDLEVLGVYSNDNYVDITMQFENDSELYEKVTKRIYIDLSAPSTNVQSLVEKSVKNNQIKPLTNTALRAYHTAKMEQTSSLDNTSYNISNKTGIFAYYSYIVTTDYLETLKNTSDVSVYFRQFADNTKYQAGSLQETSPSDFLVSNFQTIDTITSFETGKYYEIVERDKAGNMSIYTIFIANVATTQENQISNNLITLSNGTEDVYYTEFDYNQTNSYLNATHNLYAKSGYLIDNIDYFGDAWAQIKYSDINNVQYLMLSPWEIGYVYSFVNNDYTKISIAELLSPDSSRYKDSMAIYNRITNDTDTFYINLRNTSMTATLTSEQQREYISFSQPTDQEIQNPTFASLYLTELKITAIDTTSGQEILFNQINKLGYASLWKSNNNVIVSTNTAMGMTTFEINPDLGFSTNTRIVYEFVDNYGTKYKEIHIYRETIIKQEVSAKDYHLYSYYDENGNLIYITQNNFQYSYNKSKYKFDVFSASSGAKVYSTYDTTIQNSLEANSNTLNGITSVTFAVATDEIENKNYNNLYYIEIRDANNADDTTNFVKTITFRLYNELPQANKTAENNIAGEFKLLNANGNNITENIIGESSISDTGYFTEVRLLYSNKENSLINVKYSISIDKINWTEIASGTRLRCETTEMQKYYLKIWYDEYSIRNEFGTTQYIFGIVPDGQIYEFNLSALTSTYWVEKTINGETTLVEKSNKIYEYDGMQYSNHYIVNLPYSEKDAIKVKTNKEQEITGGDTPIKIIPDSESQGIYSELYILTNIKDDVSLGNIPAFKTHIVISYIPPTDNIATSFYTFNTNGMLDSSDNLINSTSKSIVISEQNTSINKIELQWSKYYGMKQNEINIKIEKDGIELNPTIYTRSDNNEDYKYTYLTYSGKYTISLYDISGNVQKFNRGTAGQTEKFTLIFLKDVPFTVTYIDILKENQTSSPEGTNNSEEENTITSMPIKAAIYNGEVRLNIDKTTRSEFYAASGYPEITVKKNGVEYINFFKEETTSITSYVFTETGYYEVIFSATSNLQDVGKIRQEAYQFTILNPNENKYSFVYNKYSNYYVEKVVKDGEDITQLLVDILDIPTITLNKREYDAEIGSYRTVQRTYLTELPLSYMDEKTGAGEYYITINSNDKLYENTNLPTNWTFKVNIKVGTAPIRISLEEGQSTTSNIAVSFNQENIYNELGECTVKIIQVLDDRINTYYNLPVTEESTGEISTEISASGTFYVQILSPSDTLLFSYKVIKNEPLNAASIIAIVISVIVVIIVGFIIFKLRKRISVK